jgi:hypothetical protein
MEKELQTELINSIKILTTEIQKHTTELEKHNNSLIKDTQLVNHDIIYFIKRYIQEILEASFGLLVVMFILKKSFDWLDFFKIVSVIGFVTLILEEYNMEAASNFKQGIYFTIGAVAYGG